MCFALDMPCGARRGCISLAAKGSISNRCLASIYRICKANISISRSENIDIRRIDVMSDNKNQLREDSIDFALEVSDICEEIKGCSVYVNQLLRSSSSIGANIHEARYAQSRADFIHKLEIALKESSETDYWLELLFRKKKLTEKQYISLRNKSGSIRRRLIASITTAKGE